MIKPLTGQCLVEIIPSNRVTQGGVLIPENVELKDGYGKRVAQTGIVRAIGPWPKAKNGFARLPEFGVGAHVILNPYLGTEMKREIGERMRMVQTKDILAVFS